jgi:hypothetical protein
MAYSTKQIRSKLFVKLKTLFNPIKYNTQLITNFFSAVNTHLEETEENCLNIIINGN